MNITPGTTGGDVGAVQQALVEAGEPIDAADLGGVVYGASTEAAVRAYQQAHGLTVDGVVGPHTWAALQGCDERFTARGWRCSPSDARTGLVEVMRWAVGKVGTVEQPAGSNRGIEIDQWNADAGIPVGSPWCAAFASAAYQCAAGAPTPRLGSALKWRDWAKDAGRIADGAPMVGDVGVILRAGGHGHVVLVAALLGGGSIATVEGNAGNAVRGLVRDASAFACFVRPLPV